MEDLNKKEIEALKLIRNSIVHTGDKPTYKKLMELLNYQSPRSINLIIRSLTDKGYLQTDENGKLAIRKYNENEFTKTVSIPVIGQVSCGALNFSEENYEYTIEVSTLLAKPPYKYFILKTFGDSMDKRNINPESLILIRMQPTASNGEVVVALVNGECTLKEFYKEGDFIILKPNSFNLEHKPIILTSDFTILGVLVTVLPKL